MEITAQVTDTAVQATDFTFPPKVVTAFTKGYCWRLANELHQLAGLPLLALGYEFEGLKRTDYVWRHMGVELPGVILLDITGIHPVSSLINDDETVAVWGRDAMRDQSRLHNEITSWMATKVLYSEHPARVYAEMVVAQLDLQRLHLDTQEAQPVG